MRVSINHRWQGRGSSALLARIGGRCPGGRNMSALLMKLLLTSIATCIFLYIGGARDV